MSAVTRCLAAAMAVATVAGPGRAFAQVEQAVKTGVATRSTTPSVASRSLRFPTLGVTAQLVDETAWSVEVRDIGNGRMADLVTGRRDGGTFTMMTTPGEPNLTCQAVLDNAAARPGARRVSNALYAPTVAGSQAVETSNGVAVFCLPVLGRPALFTVQPAQLTTAQQLSVRMLAMAVGLASGSSAAGALPADAASYGMSAGVWLSELALTVPVQAGAGWSATVSVAASGLRLDQVSSTGSGGVRLTVTASRVTDSGSDCATALVAFATNDARVEEAPAYLASEWFRRVVANPRGSFACLPLANSMIIAVLPPLSDVNDMARVRVLLIGLRLAAFERWGRP